MSRSDKYTKATNFTQQQITQGAVQGNSVDSELDNVANAYNANAERTDEIRRSDSTKSAPRLNNIIVGLDSLNADVLATIALFRDTADPLSLVRGQWVTGRAYARNDIITETVTINEAKDNVRIVVSDGVNTTTFETQGSVIDTAQDITVTGTGGNTNQTITTVGLSGGLSETGSYICLIDHTSNDFTVDLGNDRWFQFAGNSLTGIGSDITTSAAASAAAALVSETNAAVSETNAATSETNAATSASNASTSETNTAASEAAVAADAAAAAISASNAATSETNAATSETNAATSETNAGISETNAANSETNAGISETNAAASAANLQGTSTTSVPIGIGGKIFTTQAGKSFAAGRWLLITSDADPSNYMHGQVSSFVSTTLTINITNTGGSGTFSDWTIDVAGTQGAIGPVGPAGASGGLRMAFNTAVADVDQGDAQVWANNANLSLATLLFVDNVDSGATNVASQVATWDDSTSTTRGMVTVAQDADPTNFVTYDIIGANVLGTGYTKLSVVINGTPGGTLSNTDNVGVLFVRTGDKGDTGAGSGDLLAANNLSDVASALASATNLGLGTTDEVTFDSLTINHTATSAIDHAMDITLDTAGNVGPSVLNANIDVGDLAPGELCTVLNVNIVETNSTGGFVFAHSTTATSVGDAVPVAVGVGANVAPVAQSSGTFGDMDSALVNAVDELADLINVGVNTSIFVANTDTVTIGDTAQFSQIEFILTTVASGAGVGPTFEFSTGVGTFSVFAPFDGTNGFRSSGNIVIAPQDIPTWAPGLNSEFLIRITRTQGGLGTTPIASLVQVVLDLQFIWSRDGSLNVRQLDLIGPVTIPQGLDLASAATVVIGVDSDSFDLTGTTTVTDFTVTAGRRFHTRTFGILTLTDSASMSLPSGANIITAAGDVQEWFATATDTVDCVNYERADGTAIVGLIPSNNLSDVASAPTSLTNIGGIGAATTDPLTNKTIDANGAGNVITNLDIGNMIAASQAEAEAGADNTKLLTSLRTAQAIAALSPAGGKLLQVVSVTKTNTFSTSSATLVDVTGLAATITPSSASSKIFVTVSISGGGVATTGQFFQLLRGSTAIGIGDAAGSRARVSGGSYVQSTIGQIFLFSVSINNLDSPATTSAITYKIQMSQQSGATGYVNRSNNDANNSTHPRSASTITLMEIGA